MIVSATGKGTQDDPIRPDIPEYLLPYFVSSHPNEDGTYLLKLEPTDDAKITSLQARLQLEEWGELEAVEAIINTDSRLKIIWEYVSFLLIYSPMVRQIKDALGWSEDKLKQFFKEASEIVI